MQAFTSGKPRVLRHRQAPLPALFLPAEGGCWKQYDGRAGLRTAVPQSLSPAFWNALPYVGASNLWKSHRNFFAES